MEHKRLADKHDRSIAVAVKNLSYSAIHRKTGKKFNVLNDVSFLAQPGQLIAIMGPSGCGKSTLLNMIAGRIPRSSMTSGDIFYNGIQKNVTPSKFSRYVMQHDHLLEYLTVDETLTMAAKLKLKGHTPEERRSRVEAVMKELDLYDCRHTLVGGHTHKGISGGERKRVSIALELIEDPRLLFLDEPTTGLDSSRAFDTLQILISLARAGRTILCTVHSPRSPVFALFDQLVLLSKGNCVYYGPANGALTYFTSLGISCPNWCSPPDFLLDLLSSSAERDDNIVLDGTTDIKTENPIKSPFFNNDNSAHDIENPVEILTNNANNTAAKENNENALAPGKKEKRENQAGRATGTEICSHQAEWSPSLVTSSNFSTASIIDRYNDISTEAFNSNPLKGRLRITPVRINSSDEGASKIDETHSVDEDITNTDGQKNGYTIINTNYDIKNEDSRNPNRFTSNFAFSSNYINSGVIDTSKNEYLSQLENGSLLHPFHSTINNNVPNANQLSILSFNRENSYGGYSNLSFQSQALRTNDVRISLPPSEIAKLPAYWQQSGNNKVLIKKIDQHLVKYSSDVSPTNRFSLFRSHVKSKSNANDNDQKPTVIPTDLKQNESQLEVSKQPRAQSYTVDQNDNSDLKQKNLTELYNQNQKNEVLGLSSATAATFQDIDNSNVISNKITVTKEEDQNVPPSVSGIHLALAPPQVYPLTEKNDSRLLSLIQFKKKNFNSHEYGLSDLRKKHCEGISFSLLPFFKAYWWILELSILTYRLFLKDLRDIKALAGNIGQKLFSGFVLGWFFWQLGVQDSTAANNRMGLLFWLCLNTTIALHSVLAIFPSARALINKEIANGMYSSSSYYVAQNLASLPIEHIGNNIFFTIVFFMAGLNAEGGRFIMYLIISNLLVFAITGIMIALSAFSSTVELANITASLFILLFVLVAGFYVHSDNIPTPLRFLNSISYMRYAFISFLYNDLHNLHFKSAGTSSTSTTLTAPTTGDTSYYVDQGFMGDTLLTRLAFDDYHLSQTLPILLLLGFAYRFVGFFFFKFMHRRVGLEL